MRPPWRRSASAIVRRQANHCPSNWQEKRVISFGREMRMLIRATPLQLLHPLAKHQIAQEMARTPDALDRQKIGKRFAKASPCAGMRTPRQRPDAPKLVTKLQADRHPQIKKKSLND
jgi:hypothetical protein